MIRPRLILQNMTVVTGLSDVINLRCHSDHTKSCHRDVMDFKNVINKRQKTPVSFRILLNERVQLQH